MIANLVGRGFVGVDIGSRSIKVAQLRQFRNRVRLEAIASVQRKSPLEDIETTLSNPRSSFEELTAARVLTGSLRGRNAACALSMLLCELRTVRVDDDDSVDEMQEYIQAELEAQGDSKDVDKQFDFWDIRVPGEANPPTENYNVMSLSTEWAEQVVSDLRRNSLRCLLINGIPQAAAQAIELSGQDTDETTVVVDWGYSCCTLCLIHLGRPIFVRQLRRCGLINLVEAIARSLEISTEEAHTILRRHGVVRAGTATDELHHLLGNILSRPLLHVAEEINRTLVFLKSHRRLTPPRSVVVMGGGGELANAAEMLDEMVAARVTAWRPKGFEVSDEIEDDVPWSLYASAIALSSLAWAKS